MKTSRFLLVLLSSFVFLPFILPASEETNKEVPPQLTLEDIIFDSRFIRQVLGPNTLIVPRAKSKELPEDLRNALSEAELDKKSRFYVFPDSEATPPKLKSSIPYAYPQSLRQGKKGGKADFLVSIGADGAVRGVYCYKTDDKLFALAAAAAIVKWRYEPAKIKDHALPVILELPMQFRGDGYDNDMSRTTTGKNPTEIPRSNP